MKILFITHYTTLYGANKSFLSLIILLQNKYHIQPVVLLPREGELAEALREYQIDVRISRYFSWSISKKVKCKEIRKCLVKLGNIYLFPKIYRILKKENIELIHSNSSVVYLGQYLAERYKVPHVWHLREFGDKDYNLEYIYPHKYVNKKYCQADLLIAISKEIFTSFQEKFPKSKIQLVYNGIITEKKEIRKALNLECVQFCCVGRINPSKNQIEILKAAAILKQEQKNNFKVHFIGDGEAGYLEQIHAAVSEYGLQDNVKFWGFQNNVSEILEEMDIGIIPSKNEAFGRVTIEYMMARMPVLGANRGATKELVIPGRNGLIYETEKELAEAMAQFMEGSLSIRSLGEQAEKFAKENFSAEANMEKIYSIYKNVISNTK